MTPIPDRICEYLKQHEAATALELSQALECTPANIRHHLARLERYGRIELARQKTTDKSRGRPVHIYVLSAGAREQNLEGLASVLLDEILDDPQPEEAIRRMARAARRLAGSATPEGMHLTRRLNAAVRRLKDLQYHPRWEAHSDGPRIFLVHCPYFALLPAHTQAICQFDQNLLAALLGRPVKQLSRPGHPPCEFAIE